MMAKIIFDILLPDKFRAKLEKRSDYLHKYSCKADLFPHFTLV